MTPEEAQAIFDAFFWMVLTCGFTGYGIGLILKLIKSASEK
jgi:hypothetical protein